MSFPASPASTQPAPPVRWRVQLLGGVHAEGPAGRIGNFSSRSVTALLARLALYPRRMHAREELVELLWPGVDLGVGRNRLRQALFTLRRLLEPPGPVSAPVLIAERQHVGVVPGALDCDALRFEAAARRGDAAQALRLYTGELLPGFYDDWIDEERLRLAALFDRLDGAPVRTALEDAAAPDARHGAAPRHTDAARADAGASPPGHEHAVGTLPVYLTRFFGRDAEGARLRAEVLSHRLVTLLGPGGSGKTRLAVELAVSLGGPQPDTPFDFVAFVPLAGAEGREPLLDALHGSLHLRRQAGEPLAPVQAALAGRRALLVLDNFEQLAGVGEGIVAELVGTTPGLHLLVTSRRVIGLDGEREFAVRPLLLPGPGLDLGETAINPAVALFVDRARAARADFHIGRRNLAALTEIVGLLEGMPLAIELAAARVRSVTPAAMAGFLREARRAPGGRSLELLARTGPRAALDPRHASMATVIEWSWRLLDVDEAALLASLTVFRGGFAADAAHAVCGDGDGGGMLLRLDDLVAQSILRVESLDGASSRFGLYEPIRDYASLHLDAAAAQGLRRRHRAWLAGWAASLPATPSLREVRAELANIVAALASAVADGAPEEAVRLVLALRQVLEDVELPSEGLTLLEAAVDACPDAALRAEGETLLAPLLFTAGRSDAARVRATRGLDGQPAGVPGHGRALQALARVRWRMTRDTASVVPLLDDAEAAATGAGDAELLASVHSLRAYVVNAQGRGDEGEALHAQALAIWERLGNRHAINSGRYNLAVCAQNAGRHADAIERVAAIEPNARQLHDGRRLSQLLNVRGNALCGLRRWDEAAVTFRECIRVAWADLSLFELVYGLWNLPRALAHLRQPEHALRLAAFAASLWQTRFGQLGPADERDLRRVRRLAAARLSAVACERHWAEGRRLALADAVGLALRPGDAG